MSAAGERGRIRLAPGCHAPLEAGHAVIAVRDPAAQPSVPVIPAERAGLCPASESRNPVTKAVRALTPAVDYWVPARARPVEPASLGRDDSPYAITPPEGEGVPDPWAAPEAQGLYDPALEKDACGVGFIADIKGRSSHKLIEDALAILCNLEHRGAVGADPRAGDGAGILV
jgi:Glutamine amidotransferases class-II